MVARNQPASLQAADCTHLTDCNVCLVGGHYSNGLDRLSNIENRTMLQNFNMFRLHIVCRDVEFGRGDSSLPVAKNLPQGKDKMKKLLLLGLLLSLSAGCGRGWLPCSFRGASCGNGGCIGAAPAVPQGCTACVEGNAAGYGSYEGGVSGGEIIGDSYYSGNTYPSSLPATAPLPTP